MPVSDQLIDQLLADYKSPEDLLGEQGILTPFLLLRLLHGFFFLGQFLFRHQQTVITTSEYAALIITQAVIVS